MKNKAYTLIEILVAIAIFFIVVAAPTGFFVTSLKSQRKVLASQELLDNVSYTLEYISRALRMAKKDRLGDCIAAKYNYQNIDGESSIRFLNYEGKCQEFFFFSEEARLYEKKSTDGSAANLGSPSPLTSNDLEIISIKFRLSGEYQGDAENPDTQQPRVTIFSEIKRKSQIPEMEPKIKIQTTISQRNLDVRY